MLCLCSKLTSMNHPNIISFQNLFLTQNYVAIQLQLANGGNVTSAVGSFRDSYGNGDKLLVGSTDEFALQVFQQLIIAIEFCHKNRIIIRDIKPENILIDWIDVPGQGTGARKFPLVRLADFGLSKDVGTEVRPHTQFLSACFQPSMRCSAQHIIFALDHSQLCFRA